MVTNGQNEKSTKWKMVSEIKFKLFILKIGGIIPFENHWSWFSYKEKYYDFSS